MRAMFQLSRASGAEPVVWTPPPVPTWDNRERRMSIQMKILDRYVEVLEDVCARLDVPLVNFWRSFPGMVDDYPGPYFNPPDGYHTNQRAQPILARGIEDEVERIYEGWKKD